MSELRERLATAIREADPLALDNLHADWAVLTLAADLLPVVAQEVEAVRARVEAAIKFTGEDKENAYEAMQEGEWQWFQWLFREKVRAALDEPSEDE